MSPVSILILEAAVIDPELRTSSSSLTSDVILALLISLVCLLLVTCVTLTTIMCRREREAETFINSDSVSDTSSSAAPGAVKTISRGQNNCHGLFVHPNWIKEVTNIN